ncbi:MAG: hypothetical protein WCC04_05645 [Terriglobales bacterium]
MTLNEWQKRLEDHFTILKQKHSSGSTAYPIFALEHDLGPSETQSLATALEEQIRYSSPSDQHWLVWVVYAAEIGYAYSGDEYWQTFAESTPGWAALPQVAAREWIRDAFKRFQRTFNGATPVGKWSQHFSIICWPITHAILPQDLQRQLAETLYEIRHMFDSDLLSSVEDLGRQIEANSWKASSRFRQFAQEHVLLGQIASALLLTEEERANSLILPSTLQRIAADLDRERRSREWLSSARNHAAIVKLKGLSRGWGTDREVSEDEESEGPRAQLLRLGIEPTLLLRKTSGKEWEVRLNLPCLSPLLGRFPVFRDILSSQRCLVTGAKDRRPIARETFLRGSKEVPLAKWPVTGEVLLQFETSCPELDYLLHTECLIRPGPRWVFKVGTDGIAREVKGHTVRPGCEYVIVEHWNSGHSLDGSPLALACEGVAALLLQVPDTISQIYREQLTELGLNPASVIRVWPAGLPPSQWDDEGEAEWINSSRVCIGMSADCELDGIILNLVGPVSEKLAIEKAAISGPLFIDLGTLHPGNYKLHVISAAASGPTTGTLAVRIRESNRLESEPTPGTPFFYRLTPANPPLQRFWDGDAGLEIFGPEGVKVETELSLLKNTSDPLPLISRQLDGLRLPVLAADFAERFNTAKQDTRLLNAYEEANHCVVHIRTAEFGEYRLRLEREFSPIRWVMRFENQSYCLQLIEADETAGIRVFRCPFRVPDQMEVIPPSSFVKRCRLPEEGGLYVACAGDYRTSIIVPPVLHSFSDLAFTPLPLRRDRTETDLGQIIKSAEMWSQSRLSGNLLANQRRNTAVGHLKDAIIGLLCGDEWLECELRHRRMGTLPHSLEHMISTKPYHALVGGALVKQRSAFPYLSIREIAQIVYRLSKNYLNVPVFSLAREHGVSRQEWITELCVRLMYEPQEVSNWAGEDFMAGLHYVIGQPILVRATRFAVLLRGETTVVGDQAAGTDEGVS